MEENKGDRDRFHRICGATLSIDKSIIFVAILDSRGKIVVGHSRRGRSLNNEKGPQGYIFYRDSLLPVISTMKAENRSHVMKLLVTNRTELGVIPVGDKNKNWYAVTYSKDK